MVTLVTGGRGLLGKALAASLGPDSIIWDIEDGDLSDIPAVGQRIAAARPGRIFHLAAATDVDDCETDPTRAFQANVLGTWAVALGAAATGALLVQLSTDYVFDGTSPVPYREEDRPRPLSWYGTTKLLAEQVARGHSGQPLIVRTSGLFGPGGRNFVDTIRDQARDRRELAVVADQRLSPTFTLDLAPALQALVATGATGTFHLTNQGSCTWHELASRVVARLGLKTAVRPIQSAQSGRPARRPAYSVLNTDKASRLLGGPLRPWEDALDDYLSRAGED